MYHDTSSGYFIKATGRISVSWHILWTFYQGYREDQRFMAHSLEHLFWTHSLDILSRLPEGSAFHGTFSRAPSLVILSRLPGGSAFHGTFSRAPFLDTFSGHFIKATGRISLKINRNIANAIHIGFLTYLNLRFRASLNGRIR